MTYRSWSSKISARDRRAVDWKGALLYLPWCEDCDSDELAYFVNELSPYHFSGVKLHGRCARCDHAIIFTVYDEYVAHEPQRLRDRLAELERERESNPSAFLAVAS